MMIYAGLLLLFAVVALIGYSALRREMQSEIDALKRRIDEVGEPRSAERPPVPPVTTNSPALVPAAATKVESKTTPAAPPRPQPVEEEVTPEILAIIAAAVAQFVGAGARIRATRAIPLAQSSTWAQQGRVIIQASHNLARS